MVAAVRAVKSPAAHPLHRRWIDRVARPLAGHDLRMLTELVPVPTQVIPAFVCPPPNTPLPSLELELATLAATPADRVRRGLDSMKAPLSPVVQALWDSPEQVLPDLVAKIELFWSIALEPFWSRILSLHQGDILYRARRLAQGGAQALFEDLDDTVRWSGDSLRIEHRQVRGTRTVGGRGLLLVPSVFIWPQVFSVSTPPWQPTLRYSPRGIGTVWEPRHAEPSAALAGVIGRSRALLLAELDAPASTQELASRTGLTAGGTSQHLTALLAAGLVSAHRMGRFVYYARTPVAESLLTAAV
ncbi:ArsR/SmtB family transcription factor [Kribbella voronezhensis]|uniref:ArsR/SmtB family transcription factor n=1 Tax=Kribbella voronezhensis TaxID=2512212 RepID=UPI00192DA7BF|nr:winged helix-turn-helix domain-containing protein [Kribbella voronezhensis]